MFLKGIKHGLAITILMSNKIQCKNHRFSAMGNGEKVQIGL